MKVPCGIQYKFPHLNSTFPRFEFTSLAKIFDREGKKVFWRTKRILGFSARDCVVDPHCMMRLKHGLDLLVPSTQFVRHFQRAVICLKKKDIFREEKLPVFDYGKIRGDAGRIYAFGSSVHGAIGLRNLLRPQGEHHKVMLFIHHPIRLKFFHDMDIEDIAAGHGFSLVSVRRKDPNSPTLFGSGLNETSQLGYQAARVGAPMERLIAPAGISLPIRGDRPKLLAIAAGRGHSVVSVQGEGLITFGDNSSGQCGRRVVEGEKYFGSQFAHRISRFNRSETGEVVGIAARFDITICVTDQGRVYTCGANFKGQLGRGKTVDKPWDLSSPLQGDLGNEKIVKVATNGSTCLAVSEKGQLFGWGCNELGSINAEKISNILYEPVAIKLPASLGKIVDAAVGDLTTFVINEHGDVYTWGQGPTLGLGPKTAQVKRPTLIPPTLFGRNEFSPEVRVTSLCAGFVHAAAINSQGDLFTWGQNPSGCLGLGKLRHSQPFPLKVCLNGSAKRVALGVDHTMVLCAGSF